MPQIPYSDAALARRRSRAIGAMFFAFFGGAWLVLWNYRAAPHRLVPYALIAIAALLLFAFARHRYRLCDAALAGRGGSADNAASPQERRRARWFHIINVGQWVLLLIVANVLVNIGLVAWVIPAAILIVGVHFLPLAPLFSNSGLYFTGGAFILWAALYPQFAHAGPVDPIGCLGAGLILWASALASLARA